VCVAAAGICLPVSKKAPAVAGVLPDTGTYMGYLFTHMTSSDYGRLYYAVSKDGLHFKRVNGGKRIHEEYRGHTSVTKGHDGRYYMTGGIAQLQGGAQCGPPARPKRLVPVLRTVSRCGV
jgi:hypothetical protein